MKRDYTFEMTTVDGSSVVIAESATDGAESVELSTEWTTEDGVEQPWEDAVRAVLDGELFGRMNVGAGVARVERSTAVAALVDASVDRVDDVEREIRADALVAYLDFVDVWTLDGDDVVVLRDPRAATLTGREALAWAVALDVCADRIDELLAELDGIDADETEDASVGLAGTREELVAGASKIRAGAIQRGAFPDEMTTVAGRFENLVGVIETGDPFSIGETLNDHRMQFTGTGNVDEPIENAVSELRGVGNVSEAVENTSEEELAEMVEDELPELGELDGTDNGAEEHDTSNPTFDQ